MKLFKTIAGVVMACALLAVSCAKEAPVPTGVAFDKTSVTLTVDQVTFVLPQFTPSNANSTNLEWTSSDNTVATVTNGYIKGVKAGTATITVKAQGSITASLSVTVTDKQLDALKLDKTESTLYEGEDGITLKASTEPDYVTYPDITWSSSNESVATVDKNGVVTPVSIGKAVITASLMGKTATCNITVILRVPTAPETLNMWKTDKAGHRGLFGAAADEGKAAGTGDWLTYSDGVVFWTENTTGSVRTATLTLSTGSSITITQCGPAEFAGSYDFYNKAFYAANSGSQTTGSGNKFVTKVTFAETSEYAELGGKTPNLVITGLYYDFKLPACLEVDEKDGPVISFYLTNLEYQTLSNSKEVACVPELTTNPVGWSQKSLAPQKFGPDDCNYCWLPWTVDTDAMKLSVGTQFAKVQDSAYCYGLAFVIKGYAENSYSTIYQFNYNYLNPNCWFEKLAQ